MLHDLSLHVPLEKPAAHGDDDKQHTPYKMIQTIGLSVGAAVAYIINVLGLMFYCKKRRKAKRLHKGPEGEEPEMEVLNGKMKLCQVPSTNNMLVKMKKNYRCWKSEVKTKMPETHYRSGNICEKSNRVNPLSELRKKTN